MFYIRALSYLHLFTRYIQISFTRFAHMNGLLKFIYYYYFIDLHRNASCHKLCHLQNRSQQEMNSCPRRYLHASNSVTSCDRICK